MSETSESRSVPETEKTHAALARILNLSIFFVGIGVFSAAGLALQQSGLLRAYELTYFTVGVVVGVVGLLLWLVSR